MNTLIVYLRKADVKNWRVKNTRAAGFSILEMTIVLGIMAATSIAGIKVLNGKIEQNAVDRVVADLTIVAEAAYECYVAGTAGTTVCKGSNGWNISDTTASDTTASAYLGPFLPRDFSDNYEVQGIAATATGTSELVIKTVNLPNNRMAQRVAHTFGSLAQVEVGQEKVVEVTLRIPGTESALAGLEKKMKMEHFIFTPGEYSIEGVHSIKLGNAGGGSSVELTQDLVKMLKQLTGLVCGSSDAFIIKEGKFFKCSGGGSGSGSGSGGGGGGGGDGDGGGGGGGGGDGDGGGGDKRQLRRACLDPSHYLYNHVLCRNCLESG